MKRGLCAALKKRLCGGRYALRHMLLLLGGRLKNNGSVVRLGDLAV